MKTDTEIAADSTTGRDRTRPPIWRGLAAAMGTLFLLWGPAVLGELVAPYPLTAVMDSPVLRQIFGLSARSALAGLLVLAVLTALGVRLVGGAEGPVRHGLAAAVASVVAIWLLEPLRSAAREYLASAIVALPVVLVTAPLAAVWVARRGVFGSRFRPLALTALAGAWIFTVGRELELGAFERRTVMAALGAAAWLALELGGRRRRAGLIAGLTAAAVVALTLTGAGPSNLPATPPSRPDAPNVLVVMIDTWRFDHTGLGGYAKETTPQLTQLALEEGVTVFSRTWAAATSTLPSVKALFTSRLPTHWGFEGAAHTDPPEKAPKLAGSFRRAGYATAAFSANSLVGGAGFRDGFETFWLASGWQYFRSSLFPYRLFFGRDFNAYWSGLDFVEKHGLFKVRGDTVVRMASRWLRERDPERSFFLYLHLIDPHWPFHDLGQGLIDEDVRGIEDPYSTAELLKLERMVPSNEGYGEGPRWRELVGRYDEGVLSADLLLSRILAVLDELGLARDTLLVVTSDHGEEFFDHDSFSHGFDVYEEHSRVPLLVRWPRRPSFSGMPPEVRHNVSLLGLYPTLMDLLELGPGADGLTGRSWRPLLEGGDGDGAPLVVESFTPLRCRTAYVEGRFKVRMDFDTQFSPADTKFVVVFDLEADPGERRPIPAWDPSVAEVVERARKAHQARWLTWPDRLREGESAPTKRDEAYERLRSLGYLQ